MRHFLFFQTSDILSPTSSEVSVDVFARRGGGRIVNLSEVDN